MSRWTELEEEFAGDFQDAFGQDPCVYTHKVSGLEYEITFVLGDPGAMEGLDPAFCHVWAPMTAFQESPAPGDEITTPSGKQFQVFKVHQATAGGD